MGKKLQLPGHKNFIQRSHPLMTVSVFCIQTV